MSEPHRHLHPACSVCGRHHGSGISCATYAAWSEALQATRDVCCEDHERGIATPEECCTDCVWRPLGPDEVPPAPATGPRIASVEVDEHGFATVTLEGDDDGR